MSDDSTIPSYSTPDQGLRTGIARHWLFHLGLFLCTFFTTTVAGVWWLNRDPFELSNFYLGIPYSVSILFILACHEFGHYFAARYHKVDTTLPYFIPFPPLVLSFGTFGAIIRTRTTPPSKKAIFDIGVAGPIAGFLASILVLVYGFLHLPSVNFILSIHPDYDFLLNTSRSAHGAYLEFGNSIFFSALRSALTDPSKQFVPPMSEIYHYPFLCAGWFGLFVTALNLVPMGQFDGGHIIYGMFGNHHRKIAQTSFYVLIVLGLPALADALLRTALGFIYKREFAQIIPFAQHSWSTWFFWALIAYFIVKLYHPPVPDESPLDSRRMTIGWICIIIFIISFSFNPIMMSL